MQFSPGKMLRILLFLSGCCSETEVSEQLYYISDFIGRRGPYPVEPSVRACSGKFTTAKYVVKQSSDWGMDHASIINFLSNEDTQELAPGFFIAHSRSVYAFLS
jgi:hypothetical protein